MADPFLSFIDAQRMRATSGLVVVEPGAEIAPDEAAFHCLMRAQELYAKAHPLDEAELDRRATLFEFHTGGNPASTRPVARSFVADQEGAARLLRLLTQAATTTLDFEPDSYGLQEVAGDAGLADAETGLEIAKAAYEGLREEGMSALGSAITLATAALAQARRDGASPWQRLRILVEEMEETLKEIAVGTPPGGETPDAPRPRPARRPPKLGFA